MGDERLEFDIDTLLRKPLMAHLATSSPDGPRESPVWFLWEEGSIWLIGTRRDSFVRRLKTDPLCAVGIVDFNAAKGVLLHVGIRGRAEVGPMQPERLHRLLSRYLGLDSRRWNAWFVEKIVDPLDVMVQVVPNSTIARNVSYFVTGPDLASRGG